MLQKGRSSKVSVLTLGCSKNVVDSEVLIGNIEKNGLEYSENIEKSDVLIINTCGFIGSAKEENLNIILQASDLKRNGKLKKLIVTGCMVERSRQELLKILPLVDEFYGVNEYQNVLKSLDPDLKFELLGERRLLTPKHYAYLKISEGCSRECSFCSIPSIRGNHISRPLEELISEAGILAEKGIKELILIAQDTTWYGRDIYGEPKLAELLHELSEIEGIEWLRLMYIYPASFPDEILDVVAEKPNICKYFDIPFQHISDKILKSMHRGTTRKNIETLIEKIRKRIPGAAIRSTFIVGYPGETERDFRQLEDFITKIKLDRVGIFTYSHEEGTSAYKLKDNIPDNVKEERKERLMLAQQAISLKANKEKIGKKLRVIVDEKKENFFTGRTEHDAPDVDNSVQIRFHRKIKAGEFINTKILAVKEYDLFGELVTES